MSNNDRRVELPAVIVAYIRTYTLRGSDFENLTDLLTDLRHWADDAEVDFDKAVEYSENHHNLERDEANV